MPALAVPVGTAAGAAGVRFPAAGLLPPGILGSRRWLLSPARAARWAGLNLDDE